ncbi:MAG: hypothetical protein K5924_04055 [Chloroflexi bacterium]|nr:hypothetical protein [Chloroflexota bacterium]
MGTPSGSPGAPSQTPGHATAKPPLTWDLPALTLAIPTPIIAYLVSTLAGLAFFFAIVKRRRLPGDPPALVGATSSGGDDPTPSPHVEDFALAPDPPTDAGPAPDEVGVPRWLRSSLREARVGRSHDRLRDGD